MKPGYKQTELGPIPEDWELAALEEYAIVVASGRSKPDRKVGTYPVFGSTGIIGYTENPSYEGNSILVARVGANAGKLNNVTGLYGVTDNTIIIKLNNKCSLPFIFKQLELRNLNRLVFGSGQPLLTGTQIKSIILVTPQLSEQRAIAAALSDMDSLLDGLDRLIAKKRDIKQATMQQLLTGKTRLPGFEGEWEVKCLGDHVRFLRNGVNSRAELTLSDSVKYLHYGDIHASTAMQLSPANLPTLPSAKAKTLDRLNDGDLIFADASEDINGVSKSVEIYGISNTELVSGLHTIAARFDKNILANGFKAYLQFCPDFSNHLRRLAAGTKVYATNRSHIASVEMKLPSVEEQVAIAGVLADMDAEMAALEQRRRKTRDIKQAMMQELLTGRTRLLAVNSAETQPVSTTG